MAFAATSTVAVVALASILLAALKEKTAAFKAFTHPKVVYIGLISYSLYLWHWGVLSISRWTIGIHWWSVPFQIALMLGLAIASYRWIETPLRQGNWLGRRWKTLVVGGGILVTLSVSLAALSKPLGDQLYLGKRVTDPKFRNGAQCLEGVSELTKCHLFDSNSKKSLWLLGDSHALALSMAAEETAKTENMNLKLYAAGATIFPPVRMYRKSLKQRDLQDRKQDDFNLIENMLHKQLGPGDIVLLSIRLPYHFGGTYYENLSSDVEFFKQDGILGSVEDYFNEWISKVKNLANLAEAQGAIIVVQTPTPEWEQEIVKQCSISQTQWFNSLIKTSCKIRSSFFTDQKIGIFKHLLLKMRHLADSHQNIELLDTYLIVCPSKTCYYYDGKNDIYDDDDHISRQWAKDFISPQISKLIRALNK